MKLSKLLVEDEKKQEGLSYTMKYASGGFSNGVKIEPADGGKLSMSVSIYGGAPKKLTITAGKLASVLKGYEVAVKNNNKVGLGMEPEIDNYINTLTQQISFKVIDAMRELDDKIKQIITETIKGM